LKNKKYDIGIGIGTCKRPKMLKTCLESLSGMLLPSDLSVCVIIVDNDVSKSGKPVYDTICQKLPCDSYYHFEPDTGIVPMRNRVLEVARKLELKYVGFIDDDERVYPDWLIKHLESMEKTHADVTAGGVDREFESDPPDWMIKGKFLEKRQYQSGTLKMDASTANVFFKSKLFQEWGLNFNPKLSLTGSSDNFFFRQAYDRGAKIIWVAEARVIESLPDSKINLAWILKRSFRETNATVYRIRLAKRGFGAHVKCIWDAFNNLADGVVFFPFRLFMGKHKIVRSLVMFSRFGGTMAGLMGYYYKEYKRIHGN